MTIKEVEKVVGENGLEMTDFYKWIENQTVGILPDGTSDFYETDVMRFIYAVKRKENPLNDKNVNK